MQSKRIIVPNFSKTYLYVLRRPVYIKPSHNMNSLPDNNEIKSLYESLNNKASEEYKSYIKSTLSQWKPTKKYASTIASLNNLELELIFMFYRHYAPPLQNFEKTIIRDKLLYFLTNASTNEEFRFYHSIMDYYDLIEK